MSSKTDSEVPARRRAAWRFVAIAACCGVASLVIAFRPFFLSWGDAVSGGRGDSRLLIAILEHWLAVFAGHASFTSPTFFFPARHVLGYSDALFLYVPPYAVARLVGLDRYLAFEATLIAFRALGFAAMVVWLRRLGVGRPLALLGGVLFAVSYMYYLSVSHGQLAAMGLLPVLAVLMHEYGHQRTTGHTTRARVVLASAGFLLGLLLFTAFYVGWFALYVGGVVCAVALPWGVPAIRRIGLGVVIGDAAAGVAGLAAALVPFAIVYLPVLHGIGGRPFSEVALYAPYPSDVVNLGGWNPVWSHLLAHVLPGGDGRFLFAYYEAQRGWPVLLLVTFLASTAVALWQAGRGDGTPPGRLPSRTIAVLGVAAVIIWATSIQVAGVTPWALVYRLVPGASAIRVPVRINLAINVLVIAVAMLGLDRLGSRLGTRWPRATALAGGIVVLALVVEQLSTADPFGLSRASERDILARIPKIPSTCRLFYVVRPPTDDPLETIDTQTLSLLVSLDAGVPTINGYSGNKPANWRLEFFDADYPKHVTQWITAHRLARGMCILDLERGAWSERPRAPRVVDGGAS
jgi:hypothetical protein